MKEYLDLSHTLAKKQMQEKIALELVYEFLISAGLSKLLPLSHVQRIHPSLAHKASDSFFNDINQDVPASLLAARREQ